MKGLTYEMIFVISIIAAVGLQLYLQEKAQTSTHLSIETNTTKPGEH